MDPYKKPGVKAMWSRMARSSTLRVNVLSALVERKQFYVKGKKFIDVFNINMKK